MLLVDFAVAVRFVGGVGAAPSAAKLIVTVAPAADTALVVICIPVKGSTNVLPTASGESSNVVVSGVVSRSCDCTMVDVSGAMRMVTPFTAGSEDAKLSKMPLG